MTSTTMWWWWAPASVAASAPCVWQKGLEGGFAGAGAPPVARRPGTRWNRCPRLAWMPSLGRSSRWRRRSFSMWASCVALGWAVAAWSMRPCCCVRRKRFSPTRLARRRGRLAGRAGAALRHRRAHVGFGHQSLPLQDEWLRETARRMGRSPASALCHRAFSLVHRAAHMPIPFCRARSGAQGMRALWPLHHRLCGGRQKLVGQELPSPG
jgi:hypothetical protein